MDGSIGRSGIVNDSTRAKVHAGQGGEFGKESSNCQHDEISVPMERQIRRDLPVNLPVNKITRAHRGEIRAAATKRATKSEREDFAGSLHASPRRSRQIREIYGENHFPFAGSPSRDFRFSARPCTRWAGNKNRARIVGYLLKDTQPALSSPLASRRFPKRRVPSLVPLRSAIHRASRLANRALHFLSPIPNDPSARLSITLYVSRKRSAYRTPDNPIVLLQVARAAHRRGSYKCERTSRFPSASVAFFICLSLSFSLLFFFLLSRQMRLDRSNPFISAGFKSG